VRKLHITVIPTLRKSCPSFWAGPRARRRRVPTHGFRPVDRSFGPGCFVSIRSNMSPGSGYDAHARTGRLHVLRRVVPEWSRPMIRDRRPSPGFASSWLLHRGCGPGRCGMMSSAQASPSARPVLDPVRRHQRPRVMGMVAFRGPVARQMPAGYTIVEFTANASRTTRHHRMLVAMAARALARSSINLFGVVVGDGCDLPHNAASC